MKHSYDVTIIMSEYNTPIDYLKASVSSLLNQTFKNFELIIVDDCGKNDLAEIVASFDDPRIRVIKNNKNRGLVYSLNQAIAHASSNLLVRMDTDDIAMPNRLEVLHSFITQHPEYDVVGSRAIEFSGDKEMGILGKSGEKTRRSIIHGDSLVHPSVIMNKRTIERLGGYEDFHRAEDLALWSKILVNKGRLYMLEDTLLRYRVNLQDYNKRKLRNRSGEIKARLLYYPKMNAHPLEYAFILKTIVAGILPVKFVQEYRNRVVLDTTQGKEKNS